MNNKQQRQADRMAVFDKLFNPETKIIATPNAENIGLARYVYAAEGILRDAYEQVKRNVTFLQNGLVTPNDHFEGALAAFDKKAKALKIRKTPVSAWEDTGELRPVFGGLINSYSQGSFGGSFSTGSGGNPTPDVNPVLALAEKELPPPSGRNCCSWGDRVGNVTEEVTPRKGDFIMIGSRLCVIKKVKK